MELDWLNLGTGLFDRTVDQGAGKPWLHTDSAVSLPRPDALHRSGVVPYDSDAIRGG